MMIENINLFIIQKLSNIIESMNYALCLHSVVKSTALIHKSPPSWGEKMSEQYYKDKLEKKDMHLAVDAANITLEAEIS